MLKKTIENFWKLYSEPRVFVMFFIGLSCGLPLLLTGSTLSFYLYDEYGISLTKIGFFGLASLPYALKFLWAPFVDRLPLPMFTKIYGRRRGWLLFSQLNLLVGIGTMATLDASHHLGLLGLVTFYVCFSAAIQDIVMLAYQAERLSRSQYGAGEAMGVFGYRIGILCSGAGAFYLASFLSWTSVYLILSSVVGMGILTTLCCAEPKPSMDSALRDWESEGRKQIQTRASSPLWGRICSWLYGAAVCPFLAFMKRKHWMALVFLMFVYQMGDQLIYGMSGIFYADIGFTKTEIANASKVFGMIASIIGGFIGGLLVRQWGMYKSLLHLGWIHGVTTLCFILMSYVGNDQILLYATTFLEHLTGGMRMTAFLAFQLTLCSVSYAATQLALLTSAAHLGRTLFSSLAGLLVDYLGWNLFFLTATLAALPGLLIVLYLSDSDAWTPLSFREKAKA